MAWFPPPPFVGGQYLALAAQVVSFGRSQGVRPQRNITFARRKSSNRSDGHRTSATRLSAGHKIPRAQREARTA